MHEQFVTYEIALKLKELGFDEECLAYFRDGKITGVNKWNRNDWEFHSLKYKEITNTVNEIILAPLWQQAIDWLKEEHCIHINLDFGLGWGYGFIPIGAQIDFDWSHFEDGHNWDYNEARKQAVLKALNLINS